MAKSSASHLTIYQLFLVLGLIQTISINHVHAVPILRSTERALGHPPAFLSPDYPDATLESLESSKQFTTNDSVTSQTYEIPVGVIQHEAKGMAVDSEGNLFMVGALYTLDHSGYDLDTTTRAETMGKALESQSTHNSDIFVARINPVDLKLVWRRQIGTTGNDSATQVVIGKDSSVYLGGWTTGSFVDLNRGDRDALLLKLSADGELQKIKQFGSLQRDYIVHMYYREEEDAIYVTGHMGGLSPDFELGTNLHARGFAAKFTSDLELRWGKYIGKTEKDVGTGIAVDSEGFIYVSYATFNVRGGVYSILTKVDPRSGDSVWTSDTSSLAVAPAQGLSFYNNTRTTPPSLTLVMSGAVHVNNAYKLSILAFDPKSGDMIEMITGCCDQGFAKSTGGILVTSKNYLYALGQHTDAANGIGEKSPMVVSLTPQGVAVDRKLENIITSDVDARMTHPAVFNGTLYFASMSGDSFVVHSYQTSEMFANINPVVVANGTGAGAEAGGDGGGAQGGSSSGISGSALAGVLVGAILGALLLAALVAGLLFYMGAFSHAERAPNFMVIPATPAQTPYLPISEAGSPGYSPYQSDTGSQIGDEEVYSYVNPVVYRSEPI